MRNLPRGPSLLHTVQTLLDPSRGDLAALVRQYGDPFTLQTLMGPLVVTAGAEGNHTLFTADQETFAPLTPPLGNMLRASVLFQDGAAHRRSRKLLSPPFHGARMRAYASFMREATLRHTHRWKTGRPFTLLDTTYAITFDIISQALFGVTSEQRIMEFRGKLLRVLEGFSPLFLVNSLRRSFGGFGPWARFLRDEEKLRQHIVSLIDEHRRADSPSEDVLALLLLARDEAGQALSESEIVDQLLALVIAGHETTSVSLAWACYLLHRNPAALHRLRAELGTLPDAGQADLDAVVRLPFLESVCNETLRLYPPVHIIHRRLVRPLNLLGWELPAGTAVGAGVYATHRQPQIFADPERFQPERFLDKTYTPFEFLPWGGGTRRCLGSAFAMFEMKIVLATILGQHRLQLLEPRDVTWIHRSGTACPKGGIRMQLCETGV